jgi:hypothetical protein
LRAYKGERQTYICLYRCRAPAGSRGSTLSAPSAAVQWRTCCLIRTPFWIPEPPLVTSLPHPPAPGRVASPTNSTSTIWQRYLRNRLSRSENMRSGRYDGKFVVVVFVIIIIIVITVQYCFIHSIITSCCFLFYIYRYTVLYCNRYNISGRL